MSEFPEQKYYEDDLDPMWKWEVESLAPWLFGRGADIGCGKRSFNKEVIRVDIDPKVEPDIIASGDNLPFKDKELDFVYGIHAFEHFPDSKKVLKEWLRVIKTSGIIGIVHPDIDFTKKQNPEIDKAGLLKNPHNKHWHEHNLESFINQLNAWPDLPFKIIDKGPACIEWSFYVILKKV